jgi:hypothetical protein
MVDNIDLNSVIDKLSAEFDVLIEERREVLTKSEALKKRSEEIDRKLKGIQQTLQGLSLYSTSQDAPTELTQHTTRNLMDVIGGMSKAFSLDFEVPGPDAPKTLTDCCRDILRRKASWMSAVQVREALLAAGFDFSKYTSNPLSSIHTTLKRLVPDEAEVDQKPDGALYRWRELGALERRKREIASAKK